MTVAVVTTPAKKTLSAEAQALKEILELAMWHDRRCRAARSAVWRRLHLDESSPGGDTVEVDRMAIEDEENELHRARLDLAAAIAPAAIARVVGTLAPFVRRMRECGVFDDLEPAELEAFMRPIFEAAGLANDFIPAVERFPDVVEERHS